MNTLKHFVVWLPVPIEAVGNKDILEFIDYLRAKRLKPKTINCYLQSIRGFYDYLWSEEDVRTANPVKRGYALKESKPLPRYLRDQELTGLFNVIKNLRDRTMFMLMLRCGLRIEEVANLTLSAVHIERRVIHVKHGKGGKDRIVFLSKDAQNGHLSVYMRKRPPSRTDKVFLVEKGLYRGKPISVRGIQKRMEYYAKKAGFKISLSPSKTHDGNAAIECGYGLGQHPRFAWTYENKND